MPVPFSFRLKLPTPTSSKTLLSIRTTHFLTRIVDVTITPNPLFLKDKKTMVVGGLYTHRIVANAPNNTALT